MTVRRHLPWGVLLGTALAVAACNSNSGSSGAGGGGPRVYFEEPKDGASVKSPVHLKFGIADYQIQPVPQGDVTTVRPGIGHHHVGVDTDCLPPGSVIPKAAPWVHFGDGKNEMEMQLPPGQHKLALQVGDDKHTTISGLCSVITVNVTE
jgi:hypothetical protein